MKSVELQSSKKLQKLFITIACYSPVVGMPLLKITNCSRERRFCVAAETVVKLLEKGKTITFYSQVLLN